MSSELVYRYQITGTSLENALEKDKMMLNGIDQPRLVDDQLGQLYVDMELEGLSSKLKLEETSTSSSYSSGEEVGYELAHKVR